MALKCSSKNLRTFHPQLHTIVFNGRNSGLRNPGPTRELVLAQFLQFSDYPNRLTNGHFNPVSGWMVVLHFTFSGNRVL